MSFDVKAIVTSHSEKNSQLEVQYSEDGGNEVLLSCQDASAKLSSAAYQKLQEFLDCTGHRSLGMLTNTEVFFFRDLSSYYTYMLKFLKQYHHFDCTRHVVWCFKFCWGRLCLIIHCYISYHRAIGDLHSTCLHCSQEPPFSNHAFYGWRSTNFTIWKKRCVKHVLAVAFCSRNAKLEFMVCWYTFQSHGAYGIIQKSAIQLYPWERKRLTILHAKEENRKCVKLTVKFLNLAKIGKKIMFCYPSSAIQGCPFGS